MNRIDNFASVINSDEFIKSLSMYSALLHDLHTISLVRNDFVMFLIAFPLSPSKLKVMGKLNGKQKFGLLSRHLMGVSRKRGMSNLYLQSYHLLKEDEKVSMEKCKMEAWNRFFSGSRRPTDTEARRIDIAETKGKYEGSRTELSYELFRRTLDLLDFCFSTYNSRDEKLKILLD